MAYSAGKLLLEKEKALPVADVGMQQIREALKPEQLMVLNRLIEQMQPIIEARKIEAYSKAQIQSQMETVSAELTHLTGLFSDLASKLDSLENLKSANADKERIVLNKLLEVL